jgi:glycosyltransferase involved in cell wall biosynthesis
MPRFSLVIPTLQRSDTLKHALATLVNQNYDDLEIVVQNNGCDADTAAVITGFRDPRVRHFWTDAVLPMVENWETALANTTGEIVTFIGDDDGLFPNACRAAAEIFARTDIEILSWLPFTYYWPNYIHPKMRNRLIAKVDYDVRIQFISSWNQLKKFYRFMINYSQLPMIYNSFVGRRVIERVKARTGRYFWGISPDVTSGIINAASTEEFVLVTQPLSMTGVSHHSTGHNAVRSPPGWAVPEQVKRELEAGKMSIDARLVPADNLEISIASDALLVRDKFFPDDPRIELDFRLLIQFVASAINERPGFYDATRAAIETLARRHGVALSDIRIPRQTNWLPELICGARAVGPRLVQFGMDGNAVGLETIDDAVRLMEQIMPRLDNLAALELQTSDGADRAVLRPGVKVAFWVGGDGVPGLDYGWSEPESWGVWTAAKKAKLRLRTRPDAGAIRLDIAFRPFLHRAHPRLDLAFWVDEEELAGLECRNAQSQVFSLVIPSERVSVEGSFDLEFDILDPRSPAELGVSADPRMLGIGLEWLMIAGSD